MYSLFMLSYKVDTIPTIYGAENEHLPKIYFILLITYNG